MLAKGFLADIIENPQDDFPRLAYADWLDDTGVESNVIWAKLIRVQCELEAMPDAYVARSYIGCRLTSEPYFDTDLRAINLAIEEHKILYGTYADAWTKLCPAMGIDPKFIKSPVLKSHWRTFNRGFVCSIKSTWEDFRAEASHLFSTVPIETVELLDKSPLVNLIVTGQALFWRAKEDASYHWHVNELFPYLENWNESRDYIKVYNSTPSALKALSNAAVAWGRDQARGRHPS
jgi:uncharacterized protein (TIGR02996 family)